MQLAQLKEHTDAYVLATYGRRPLAFEEGSGAMLTGIDGAEYLDFTSGLGVNALGYGHPAIAALVTEQASKVFHTSNLYQIPSQTALAEKLCGASFGERVFFCNSGTESVEAAIKFARKRGSSLDPSKTDIIAFENSFHGRTYGALSATMQEKYQQGFQPLVPGFKQAVFNDIESVKNVIDTHTAAVIIEPLQGEGGINLAETTFMRELETLCHEHDALLIVDEVQCGMGRTGTLFAYEQFEIIPDIMTLAKPLAGGLPIGAVVLGPRAWPHIKAGEHASTFGGNHFVTAVACGVFDIINDPSFLSDVAEKGAYLNERLDTLAENHACITQVKGTGLLQGVAVNFPAIEAMQQFETEHILICIAGPQVVRFIPPLIVTTAQIDRVVDTLDRYLAGRNGC